MQDVVITIIKKASRWEASGYREYINYCFEINDDWLK
jgi:hypothetical protein